MERNGGRWKRPGEPKKEQGRGQGESKELQPLPSVWNILEHRVKLNEGQSSGRITEAEYWSEQIRLNKLSNALYEKGTARDKLIGKLYTGITLEPSGTFPIPVDIKHLSLEEFKQFRSKVEPMSDEQIVVRKYVRRKRSMIASRMK